MDVGGLELDTAKFDLLRTGRGVGGDEETADNQRGTTDERVDQENCPEREAKSHCQGDRGGTETHCREEKLDKHDSRPFNVLRPSFIKGS